MQVSSCWLCFFRLSFAIDVKFTLQHCLSSCILANVGSRELFSWAFGGQQRYQAGAVVRELKWPKTTFLCFFATCDIFSSEVSAKVE